MTFQHLLGAFLGAIIAVFVLWWSYALSQEKCVNLAFWRRLTPWRFFTWSVLTSTFVLFVALLAHSPS